MNFDPVKALEDSQTAHLLDIYRDIEADITGLALYGDTHGKRVHTPVAHIVTRHYKVERIEYLSDDHIKEIWAFAKGLNEVGGLWMVFHSLRRVIQDWMAATDKASVDLNAFWINEHEIVLHPDR